jgi:hypothetical protein
MVTASHITKSRTDTGHFEFSEILECIFKARWELVADINTETMDMDVETLMGLIHRRAYGLPDARYIMAEIERARLRAEGIVTRRIGDAEPGADGDMGPRRGRRRWKIGLKSRIANLVLRVVRINFRYQETFNNSVVRVLQLMAEDLYAYERRLGVATGDDESVPLPRVSARARRRARIPLRTRRATRGFRRSWH